jgi:hypothetical protein
MCYNYSIMAITRGSGNSYNVGNTPPQVTWTVVRGDTASFRVYVTDDAKLPLTISEWSISAKVKRPTLASNTDDATLVLTLSPVADVDDAVGEFTVSLTAGESESLATGDIFDIQLSDVSRVWTVAQGSFIILEDVTD